MADVSQERGYGGEQKPALAHQDEFGHKMDNDSPAIDGSGYGGVSESEPPHHKIHTSEELLPKPTAGYGDEGLQENGEEAYAPAEESTPQNPQFGLEGKTASNGSTGATVPDREEESHEAAGYGAPPTGSAIDEDSCKCPLISCCRLLDTKLNWFSNPMCIHVIGWNHLKDHVEIGLAQ